MAKDQSKCAHLPYVCVPTKDEKFCTQFCKDAGAEETEIVCDRGHPVCTR
jgi:hypothetical protein